VLVYENDEVNKLAADTTYRERRLIERMRDPEFKAEYLRAQSSIAQVDAVMRSLDNLREAAGISKAQLARQIDKNPASVRRLFTSEVNPELKTIAAMAYALDAELVVQPRKSRRRMRRRARTPRGKRAAMA
jgi:ribosome-binding protein aMBF1 (putative translation factor)